MLAFIISFLVLLNPFALFIYTIPLYKQQRLGTYFKVMIGASIISYLIYAAFAVTGEGIFNLLKIDFESFRIFGGIVLISFALSFILQGKESMITTRGEIGKIASEVALPFIVGAGTITQSILIGEAFNHAKAVSTIAIVMFLNFIIVCALMVIRDRMPSKFTIAFDKNAEILLRINGFLVGAYGIDLVIVGIANVVSA